MQKVVGVLLVLVLGVSVLQAGKGKIRVACDHKGAYVYVDGKKKAMTGEGFTSILLEEGEYTIKIIKKDSETYNKIAIKKVFVGEDSSVKIKLVLDTYEHTKQYMQNMQTIKKQVREGSIIFDYACSSCHILGKITSGPDLIGVLDRHENGEQWTEEFIRNPEKKFNDPYIMSMINYFGSKMPNKHLSDVEIKNIIEYLKWAKKNVDFF